MKRLMRSIVWAVALVLLLTSAPLAGDVVPSQGESPAVKAARDAVQQADKNLREKALAHLMAVESGDQTAITKTAAALDEAVKQQKKAREELANAQRGGDRTSPPREPTAPSATPPSGTSPDAPSSGNNWRSDEANRLRKNAKGIREQVEKMEREAKTAEDNVRRLSQDADAERKRASSLRADARRTQNPGERRRLETEADSADRRANELSEEARKQQRTAAEGRTVAEGLRREALTLERHARYMQSETQSRGTLTDEASRLTRGAKELRELVEQNEREARAAEQNARELNQLADAEKKHANSLRADARRTQNPGERRRLETEADSADRRANELSEEARKQQQKAAENTAIGDGLRHEAQNMELEANQRAHEAQRREALEKELEANERAREAQWREALDKLDKWRALYKFQLPRETAPPRETTPHEAKETFDELLKTFRELTEGETALGQPVLTNVTVFVQGGSPTGTVSAFFEDPPPMTADNFASSPATKTLLSTAVSWGKAESKGPTVTHIESPTGKPPAGTPPPPAGYTFGGTLVTPSPFGFTTIHVGWGWAHATVPSHTVKK